MKKIKIFLYGKHSHRTPFSYKEYRTLFSEHFEYVSDATKAEYLVTGYRNDFINNAEDIQKLRKKNPKLSLVVFSEEPLWDTLWSGDFRKPKNKIKCKVNHKDITFDYHVINHITSNVFNFINIPYFITTSNDFYIRYSNMFLRNVKLGKDDFKLNWKNAKFKYAFYAAKRIEEKYDVSYNGGKILGINRFRSLLADKLDTNDVLREGEGWGTEQKRQKLPDWHLDKLATLDRNSYIVSAMENTHLDRYISEKIFDAFALQAIPIYFAQKKHKLFSLLNDGSFINLADLSVEESINKIMEFNPDNEFMENYINSQYILNELFSDVDLYLNERTALVNRTIKHFRNLRNGIMFW